MLNSAVYADASLPPGTDCVNSLLFQLEPSWWKSYVSQ